MFSDLLLLIFRVEQLLLPIIARQPVQQNEVFR
jgi:hypothetical protein